MPDRAGEETTSNRVPEYRQCLDLIAGIDRSPALIELPELNDDWPIKTCAGTRLRNTGMFS